MLPCVQGDVPIGQGSASLARAFRGAQCFHNRRASLPSTLVFICGLQGFESIRCIWYRIRQNVHLRWARNSGPGQSDRHREEWPLWIRLQYYFTCLLIWSWQGTRTWKPHEHQMGGKTEHKCVEYGNALWFVGGYNGYDYTNDIHRYDPGSLVSFLLLTVLSRNKSFLPCGSHRGPIQSTVSSHSSGVQEQNVRMNNLKFERVVVR